MSSSRLTKQLAGLMLSLVLLLNCSFPTFCLNTPSIPTRPNRSSSLGKKAPVMPYLPPGNKPSAKNSCEVQTNDPEPVPPLNDNFDDAQDIEDDTGSVTADNSYATGETGEPDHASHAAGLSIWYRWPATTSSNVTFDTAGSYIDTVLSVYTGSSVSTLTEVASNDDVPSDVYSTVSFAATANTVYYIALDVFDGAGYPGTLNLNWQPSSATPNPTLTTTNKLTFASYRGITMEVFVMNDDGGAQTRLTEKTSYADAPVWSPDGEKLAFHTYRDGHWQIYLMDADGLNQTLLTNILDYLYPAWSPDGEKLAFTGYDAQYNSDVFVINADGSGLTNLTNDSTGTSYLPSWSPNGTKLMFLSRRDGPQSIYVMNADGTNLTRLTSYEDDTPVWSRDGTKIAFVSWRDGSAEIYVMNADGTNQTNLTNTNGVLPYPPSNTMPDWSPDGTSIAFTTNRDGQSEIYVMDADGSNQTSLTSSTESSEPRWSPDGTKIAFLTYRDGNQEIYVMDADGSNQVNLTNNPAYDATFRWQPL